MNNAFEDGDKVKVLSVTQDYMAYTDTEGEYEEYSEEWWEFITRLREYIGKSGTVTHVGRYGCFVEVEFTEGDIHYFAKEDLAEEEA